MGVVDEAPVGGSHVHQQILDPLADQLVGHGLDGRGRDVVAATGGEDEAGPDEAVARVGGEAEIGRRVVRIGVHRVGAVELLRRGEPDVDRFGSGNGGHGVPLIRKN
jgi:hypothetical protein